MGELKKQHADEIDFSKAGALLKDLLNKLTPKIFGEIWKIRSHLKISII